MICALSFWATRVTAGCLFLLILVLFLLGFHLTVAGNSFCFGELGFCLGCGLESGGVCAGGDPFGQYTQKQASWWLLILA